MKTLIKIHEMLSDLKGYLIIRHSIVNLLFILAFFSSCNKPHEKEEEPTILVEGNVTDIISHEPLNRASVQIIEWRKHMFEFPSPFPIKTGYTDATGYFQINFESNHWGHTLNVSKDRYLTNEYRRLDSDSINKENIGLFPHGYVKTHIVNKIDTAKLIFIALFPADSSFTYDYHIVDVVTGYINNYLTIPTFADTTLITTTAGGIMNKLTITMFSDYDYIHEWLVKDTSFLTLRFDTVYLNKIILY